MNGGPGGVKTFLQNLSAARRHARAEFSAEISRGEVIQRQWWLLTIVDQASRQSTESAGAMCGDHALYRWKWMNGAGLGRDVINPATEKPLAHLPHASTAKSRRSAQCPRRICAVGGGASAYDRRSCEAASLIADNQRM